MRKYMLADGSKRSVVDLRDYEGIIKTAVEEFAPGIAVEVHQDYYVVFGQLTHSQAVKIGRKICESDLSQHCIKLSKLFNSTEVKEKSDDNRKEQKRPGGHH